MRGHKGAGAPTWYGILLLSERWSIPPWEIAGRHSPLWWIQKQAVVDRIREDEEAHKRR